MDLKDIVFYSSPEKNEEKMQAAIYSVPQSKNN